LNSEAGGKGAASEVVLSLPMVGGDGQESSKSLFRCRLHVVEQDLVDGEDAALSLVAAGTPASRAVSLPGQQSYSHQ
jgi:hypothetical protein